MELLQDNGHMYQDAFGAEDVTAPAMRRAILKWFGLYYGKLRVLGHVVGAHQVIRRLGVLNEIAAQRDRVPHDRGACDKRLRVAEGKCLKSRLIRSCEYPGKPEHVADELSCPIGDICILSAQLRLQTHGEILE